MAGAKKAGRGSDQFPLRLPDGMRDAIKTAADANGRSMNAEIVDRLDASLTNAMLEDAERRDYARRIDLLLDNEARLRDAATRAVAALDKGDVAKARELLVVGAYFDPKGGK